MRCVGECRRAYALLTTSAGLGGGLSFAYRYLRFSLSRYSTVSSLISSSVQLFMRSLIGGNLNAIPFIYLDVELGCLTPHACVFHFASRPLLMNNCQCLGASPGFCPGTGLNAEANIRSAIQNQYRVSYVSAANS